MRIVLRIGGSVLGSPPAPTLVLDYANMIEELEKHHRIGVVVGGGAVARQYIAAANELGLSHEQQDKIAIQVSRLNAGLVCTKIGGQISVPTSANEMISLLRRRRVAVMGGLRPGITTDTVAAMIAEAWKADLLVKASDREGIFTSDPAIDKKAKLLHEISYSQLKQILGGKHRPGIHSIVDPVAVNRIVRQRIRLIVIDGRNTRNVLLAVRGEKVGTTVS